MVYRRSPTMAGPAKPSPSPLVFHSNLGPLVGQDFKSPVSLHRRSRLLPPNAGQSSLATRVATSATHISATLKVFQKCIDCFIGTLLSHTRDSFTQRGKPAWW